MYDVLNRWGLVLCVISVQRFLWNIRQWLIAGLHSLQAGQGGYPQVLPVSVAVPLRRRGGRRSGMLRVGGGGRNSVGVVQGNIRTRVFPG